MKKQNQIIYDLFAQVISKKVKNSCSGVGSFIFINFGMDLVAKSPIWKEVFDVRSEWYFWVDMSFWELEIDGKIMAYDEDYKDKIDDVIKKLIGKKLLNVEILSDEYDMVLTFESGIVLHLIADNTEEDNEQWSLFTPDRMVLTAGPFKKLTYKHTTDPIDED